MAAEGEDSEQEGNNAEESTQEKQQKEAMAVEKEEVVEFERLQLQTEKPTQDLINPTQEAKKQERESMEEWQEFRNVLMEILDDANTLSSGNKKRGKKSYRKTQCQKPNARHKARKKEP